ncbi:hypothetical protein CR513_13214, partial [Mucuna pruriens]
WNYLCKLCTWGCPAEARPYRPHERKLNSRKVNCYFVGYAKLSRGYKFYDLTSRSFLKQIYSSIHDIGQVLVPITIQEKISIIGDNVQTIVLDIALKQDYDEVLPQTPIEQPQQPQEVSLSRSIKERRHAILDNYIVFFQEHEDDIGLIEDDPINFCQVMQSSNSQKLIDAMKDEMKSVQDNDTWDLIELPEDYFRIIIALVTHFDLELHQMHAKTAFLNGDIDETIYSFK